MSSPLSPARTAPTVVTASFWLWIASAVISLLAFFLTLPVLLDSSAASGAYAGGLVVGSIAGALLGAALRIVFAIFLLRGANWARIVLTVIGALVLLSLIPSAVAGDLLGILVALIAIAAGVLMWLPAARPHFRRA